MQCLEDGVKGRKLDQGDGTLALKLSTDLFRQGQGLGPRQGQGCGSPNYEKYACLTGLVGPTGPTNIVGPAGPMSFVGLLSQMSIDAGWPCL